MNYPRWSCFLEYQEYYFYEIVKRKIYISTNTYLVGYTTPSFKSIYAKRLHYTENDLLHSILRAPNRYHIVSVICNRYIYTTTHNYTHFVYSDGPHIQFPIIVLKRDVTRTSWRQVRIATFADRLINDQTQPTRLYCYLRRPIYVYSTAGILQCTRHII